METLNKNIAWYDKPIEQVLQELDCSREGLTSEAVDKRLAVFSPNNVEDETWFKWSCILKLCWRNLWSPQVLAMIIWDVNQLGKHPIPLVIVFAIFVLMPLMFAVANDIDDMYIRRRVSKLVAPFARKAKVLRDGKWCNVEASDLVPGDVIIIKAGDIVPADCLLLEGDALLTNHQSTLTRESSSGVMKTAKGAVYSGSICEQGESKAVIVATGVSTSCRKKAHQAEQDTYLDKVMATIKNISKWLIVVGISVEIIVMYGIQHRSFRQGIENLVVLIIVGYRVMLHKTIVDTISDGFRDGAKGAILKRLFLVKEMADMDIVCYDTSFGTLTQDKPTIPNDLIEVLVEGVDVEMVSSMADRACRTRNHSDHATSELHFCNLKCDDKVYHVCIGPPEKILSMAHNKEETKGRVKRFIEKFRDSGFRQMAVAYQAISEEATDDKDVKDDVEVEWKLIGVLPVFNSPKCDSVDFTTRASDLGIDVKIFTVDPLPLAKETSRSIGKGANIYPSFSLLRTTEGSKICDSSIANLIENADGFSDVLPGHMHSIIEQLQSRKHLCVMMGNSVGEYLALEKADIGVADLNACDAAREACDLLLTEASHDVLLNCFLTSRNISQQIKAYCIHAIAFTVYSMLAFVLLALLWKFDYPPNRLMIVVCMNEVQIYMAGGFCYKVKPSTAPDRWTLAEVVKIGTALGVYQAATTILFFWAANYTNIFQRVFGVGSEKIGDQIDYRKLVLLMSLNVTMSSNAILLSALHRSGLKPRHLMIYVFALMIIFPLDSLGFALIFDYESPGLEITRNYCGWVAITWLFSIMFHVLLVLFWLLIQRTKARV